MKNPITKIVCLLGVIAFMGCQPSDRNVSPQGGTDLNRPSSDVTTTNSSTNDLNRPVQPNSSSPR